MTFPHDFSMTIDGRAAPADGHFDVINPATERAFASAPECSRAQLDEAVASARAAFPVWAATPMETRRKCVHALGQLLIDNAETLMAVLTMEQGKPHREARMEVSGSGMRLQAIATQDLPTLHADDGAGRLFETRHMPLGVVGAIVPWNFPLALAVFKLGPALLTGNTVILKPSPFTPLTTLAMGELARAVLPPGVFNVVSGGDALGPWITAHQGIDKITFTGSTQTGRRVMESAALTLKRVTLELGGNDAAIVLPDADVRKLAEQLFWSAFTNNGQLCIATKRLYIHDAIYRPLTTELAELARTVKVGDGAQPGTQLGPINNRPQYQRVLGLLQDIRDSGYTVLAGGGPAPAPGYFVPVTLVDDPPDASRIVREEQFGPVLPLLRFSDIDDAIARANASEFGLGGSVWSADEDRAAAVARRLDTGSVFINGLPRLSAFAPFAGRKQSGVGIEGGIEGMLEFTSPQTVFRNRPTG
ncbi:MAG: aldehyde dehydrogenase family protein [Rhodospirillaceae bacterium]|nr:MAG: aldehyde dehydrogenase family protein [Rhodospirillaceae bacterium]